MIGSSICVLPNIWLGGYKGTTNFGCVKCTIDLLTAFLELYGCNYTATFSIWNADNCSVYSNPQCIITAKYQLLYIHSYKVLKLGQCHVAMHKLIVEGCNLHAFHPLNFHQNFTGKSLACGNWKDTHKWQYLMPENEPATAAEVVSEVVAALLGLTILFSLFCMGTVMDSKIFGVILTH